MSFYNKADDISVSATPTFRKKIIADVEKEFPKAVLTHETLSHLVFIDEEKAIKISKTNKNLSLESYCSKIGAAENVFVKAELFWFDDGRCALIQKKVEPYSASIDKTVEKLKLLHKIEGGFYGKICSSERHCCWSGYIKSKLQDHINNSYVESNLELRNRIWNVFQDYSEDFPQKAMLHGDLSKSSVVKDDGEVKFIDYDECLFGDPIFDLACYDTFVGRSPRLIFDAYLDSPSDKDVYNYWIYYLRISIAKSAILSQSGIGDSTGRIETALEKLEKLK
jgi:hypothetical protein